MNDLNDLFRNLLREARLHLAPSVTDSPRMNRDALVVAIDMALAAPKPEQRS